MNTVPHQRPDVSPLLTAAMILAARTFLVRLDLPHPTVEQILKATSATRSRAYELKEEILRTLPDLDRPIGRPPATPPAEANTEPIVRQVQRFVMQHPGCVHVRSERQRYSDSFRCFILELYEQHRQLPLPAFASAVNVPEGTLKDWLQGGLPMSNAPAAGQEALEKDEAACGRVETILDEWKHWKGDFTTFCKHLRFQLRIPYGRTLIANILERHSVRMPSRRSGRSPDEKALRQSFETFFPGAQWEGDGKSVAVRINGRTFVFNLELMADSHTDAFVGFSLRDEEDHAAVTQAFQDGVEATGVPPLAVLLDNRPVNFTSEVGQALGDTLRIRATQGRGQSKPHVEGGFGLFSQSAPPLVIAARSLKEMARQILLLVFLTWGRTLNHKPRPHGQPSRFQLYQEATPSQEQIAQARASLKERCRKQELALQTLKARQDPVVRNLLDEAFLRLDLLDPQANIRAAIARYSLDAILAGIATFEGKREVKTLPDGVDGRYLLGIVRNLSQQDEGLHITEALLRSRLAVRDRLLLPLLHTRDTLRQNTPEHGERLKFFIDHALEADRRLDHLFWLQSASDLILERPFSLRTGLLRFAARRIFASFSVPYKDRLAAMRSLVHKVVPLD
ncbi:MAG: hypothetical protein HY915_01940 [Desulfovibrio sp.]|nr:hypothetical protein [Desulfovibrio sp.]